jgi:hypothetical protein
MKHKKSSSISQKTHFDPIICLSGIRTIPLLHLGIENPLIAQDFRPLYAWWNPSRFENLSYFQTVRYRPSLSTRPYRKRYMPLPVWGASGRQNGLFVIWDQPKKANNSPMWRKCMSNTDSKPRSANWLRRPLATKSTPRHSSQINRKACNNPLN